MNALTPEKQLELWVAGQPKCPNTHGECCPDFSCCKPELLQPLEARKAFAAADQKTREGMLFSFLDSFAETVPSANVHVVGRVKG